MAGSDSTAVVDINLPREDRLGKTSFPHLPVEKF